LLRIKSGEQLETHPYRGAIFENWVIVETIKHFLNRGEEAPVYFWRDQHGHEVDMVLDRGTYLDLFEIKAGQTFQREFLKNVEWLNKLQGRNGGACIYGGSKALRLGESMVLPWDSFLSVNELG
jgi:predicted AAA+ superfamily ATPase